MAKLKNLLAFLVPFIILRKTTILLIAANFWDLPKKFKKQTNSRSSNTAITFFFSLYDEKNQRKVYECHPMDTHARHSTDELLRSLDLCQAYTACGFPLGFGYTMQMRNIKQKGPSCKTVQLTRRLDQVCGFSIPQRLSPGYSD